MKFRYLKSQQKMKSAYNLIWSSFEKKGLDLAIFSELLLGESSQSYRILGRHQERLKIFYILILS